jgi:pectate lyase
MKYNTVLLQAFLAISNLAAAQKVVGKAEGFAAGVTGGGNASPVYPKDISELKAYLTDESPQVIVLDKVFDFTTSEGTESGTACASWGTGSSCQKIIQDSCGTSPAMKATWHKAARAPIDVASHKTIVGVGSSGAIKGKGLRFRGGTTNVIVQNIAVTDLNPEFVWGGDAISFDGSDLIWIDHVTVSLLHKLHILKMVVTTP